MAVQDKMPAYADIIYPAFNFAGGLNTKSSQLFLDQQSKFSLRSNQLPICTNMLRTSSGGLVTRPGRVKLNSTPLSPAAGTAEVRSIHELRSAAGVDKIICNAGNTVYVWNGASFVSLGTVATPNTRFHWCQFQDILIGVDGTTNGPIKYDGGAAIAPLGGTPPTSGTAIANYRNRVWIIKGRTLYYSALGNAEDWTSVNNAGSLPIPTTLGQGGTAIIPMWDRLIVYANQQVFQLEGTSPGTFALKAINLKYGHSGPPHGVMAAGNDIYFFNQRGLQALSATESQSEVGEIAYNYASGVIEPTWQDIDPTNIGNVVVANDVQRNLLVVLCGFTGSQNNQALVADYYHLNEDGTPTWSLYNNMPFSSVFQVTSLNNIPEILFGSYDGYVYRQTTDETDDGTPISFSMQYVTDGGEPGFIKTWRHAIIFARSQTATITINASFDFGDRVLSTVLPLNVGDVDTIGSTFRIGVSALGSIVYTQRKLAIPGHGRHLVLNVSGSTTKQVTIGGFLFFAGLRRAIQG